MADAVGERIDQRREVGRLPLRQRRTECLRPERLGAADVQRERVDAVSGIDLLDPPRDQAVDMRRVAGRAGEADAQHLRLMIDPAGHEQQGARAQPGAGERCGKLAGQAAEPMVDRLGGEDRLGEAALDGDRLRRRDGDDRLGGGPGRLIRRTSGARGITSSSPIVSTPSRSSSSSASASSRSAATGRGASATRWAAGGMARTV